jgi:hypothetical protein
MTMPQVTLHSPPKLGLLRTFGLDGGGLVGLAGSSLLVKEKTDKADGDNTNDAEDNDNASLLRSPVLALGELVGDRVAGHERLDSGHCVRSGEITK